MSAARRARAIAGAIEAELRPLPAMTDLGKAAAAESLHVSPRMVRSAAKAHASLTGRMRGPHARLVAGWASFSLADASPDEMAAAVREWEGEA